MLRALSCRQSTFARRISSSSSRHSEKNHRRQPFVAVLVCRRNFFSSPKKNTKSNNEQNFRPNFVARDRGLGCTSVVSNPQEVPSPDGIVVSRTEQLRKLQEADEYDVLVIGGGATGAGAALDAASRGYSVACLERGDFASETSSRSTKLIWAGIKYMGTAVAALLSRELLTAPVSTVNEFWGEMKMVYNCHRERRFMVEKQNHLCHWIPIVIPFDRWHISPPPFGHPLYGLFPMVAPLVLKFYDALSWFSCPPSFVLTRRKIPSIFPQLDAAKLKYCAVFYEAQHNDARTNLAIAMTAAKEGANICNYVEMRDVIKDEKTGKAIGVMAVDRMTNQIFTIHAKKIVFCGGPFTDSMRKLEASPNETFKPAVGSAHGTHIVLPGYYCPSNFGLLDFNTSDKRFLFYLPWQGHTLVGTTDTKTEAETLPRPPEEEIEWIVKESSKYLKFDVRRRDVLSSWRGWRPLAVDPHADEGGGSVSRDHVISEHPTTGVIFIAGGKWTTWREMAQAVIDHAVGTEKASCRTLDITLWGGEGDIDNLSIELIQDYDLSEVTAKHLVKTYGIHALDVCKLILPTTSSCENATNTTNKQLLAEDHPYIKAEVVYACREYACTIEDILSRRTRLAFLNKEAALKCIHKVGSIMQRELGWSSRVTEQQIKAAEVYIESYGGGVRPQQPIIKINQEEVEADNNNIDDAIQQQQVA